MIPNFILSLWRKYREKSRERRKNSLKKSIIDYLENMPPEDATDEKSEVLKYLKHNPISVFPYFYTEKHQPEDVIVYVGADTEMPYILQDGKRLYFKKGWDEKQIQNYYNGLLIEQDEASPHRYETPEFYVSEGDVVVDAGVAEGNFALSIIEKVKKIYLFEADETWVEALEATFAPWKEKVDIVNKYVSDVDRNNHIRLDTILKHQKIDFIKADIEGSEAKLLTGSEEILSTESPMKIILCTYHKHNDAETLDKMLKEKGFVTEFSKGYMVFFCESCDKLVPPFLRRGVIRARRLNKLRQNECDNYSTIKTIAIKV
jgi:predicted RNA methylase